MGKSFSNGKMWNCANRSMGEWESGEMGRGANEQMEHGELWNGKTTGGKGGMRKYGHRFLAQPFWHRQETTQESSCPHARTQKVAFQILWLVGTAA